jgi:hypothetical protein
MALFQFPTLVGSSGACEEPALSEVEGIQRAADVLHPTNVVEPEILQD